MFPSQCSYIVFCIRGPVTRFFVPQMKKNLSKMTTTNLYPAKKWEAMYIKEMPAIIFILLLLYNGLSRFMAVGPSYTLSVNLADSGSWSEFWYISTVAYWEPEAYLEPWDIENLGIFRTLACRGPEACSEPWTREAYSEPGRFLIYSNCGILRTRGILRT